MKITLGQYFNQAIDIYRSASLEEKIATTTLGVLLLVTAGLMPATRIDAGDSALVNIYVDGDKRSLTTNADTVAEVLDRAGISIEEHDLVEPSIEAEITNEVFNINIYRAYPAIIIDGDDSYEVMSAYDSARLIVRHSGVVDIHDEDKAYMDLVVDFLQDRYIGRKVIIERATPVSLSLGGEDLTVRTHATTVGEMFEEMDIEVGNNDILKPSLDTEITPGVSVTLTQIGFETIIVTEEVEPETETIYDNDRPLGYNQVESEGVPGAARITYEIEYQNGEEVSRRVLHRSVEVEPEARVIVTGNRADVYSNNTDKLLYDLRMCEAGGIYSRNSGNGFYGAYQFMIDTWNRVAPKVGRPDLVGVRPDRADPADQDFMVVENAKLSAGGFWSQHPGCSRLLGLPRFP
ncbi:MAG: ubiquitin-like domain-containing protein [Candidatus Saccharimonadales bacterium]